MRTKSNKYEIGDIVFVSKYKYDSTKTEGKNHLFVIINEDTIEAVTVEYFGLIVSSHREKSKDNSIFKYNEPLDMDSNNGLHQNSIVKCDEVYSIPPQNIQFKIGSVDVDDYLRFIESYSKALKELEEVVN